MTPAQIARATDTELRAVMNAPRSDGETILSEKSDEWARRYRETNDSADLAKAMDCARASLTLYDARMADRKAAYAEWTRRQNGQNAQPTVSDDTADSANTYGTPAHEQALIAEERESERWANVNLQDAYSQIGRRETKGLADESEFQRNAISHSDREYHAVNAFPHSNY